MKRRASAWQQLTISTATVVLMVSLLACLAKADNGYKLHGGDQLLVNVYGEQTLTGPQTVLPDGTIDMPLVGKIHVGGQSPEQAAQTVTYALEKFVRHPVVTVAVTQQGPIGILVLGDVKSPGKYALQPSASNLTDAIAAAGGMGPVDGPYPDARIAQPNGGAVDQVSLQQLLHDGDTSKNMPLQDGQIVYIPSPVTFNVYVAGAVDHPGEIQVNEGDDVAVAVIKAGNSPSANGDLNNVTVTRLLPDGQKKQYGADLYKVLEPGGSSQDVPLQKGDLVFVPSIPASRHVSGVLGQSFFYISTALRALFGTPIF
jgi:polysaccharide export outer membrane protein